MKPDILCENQLAKVVSVIETKKKWRANRKATPTTMIFFNKHKLSISEILKLDLSERSLAGGLKERLLRSRMQIRQKRSLPK